MSWTSRRAKKIVTHNLLQKIPLHGCPQLWQRFPELLDVLLISITCSPCLECVPCPDRQRVISPPESPPSRLPRRRSCGGTWKHCLGCLVRGNASKQLEVRRILLRIDGDRTAGWTRWRQTELSRADFRRSCRVYTWREVGEIAGFPPHGTSSAPPCLFMARPKAARAGAGASDDLGVGRRIAIYPATVFMLGRHYLDGEFRAAVDKPDR
jgi:hypothetical protein